MLDKLRRKSRQDSREASRRTSIVTFIPPLKPTAENDTRKEKTTFFSLPAEIRNAIYEEVVKGILLRIPSVKERSTTSTAKLPAIPSLLLVSRRTRNEYLPILLESARIRVVVKDFDFRGVARVCRSLYSTELKALRNNRHLRIELLGDKCSKDSLVALRRWLENRGRGLDRLPWTYRVAWKAHQQILPTSAPVSMANAYLLRKKILRQNLEQLTLLHGTVGEMVGFELLAVIDAFQMELTEMSGGDASGKHGG